MRKLEKDSRDAVFFRLWIEEKRSWLRPWKKYVVFAGVDLFDNNPTSGGESKNERTPYVMGADFTSEEAGLALKSGHTQLSTEGKKVPMLGLLGLALAAIAIHDVRRETEKKEEAAEARRQRHAKAGIAVPLT